MLQKGEIQVIARMAFDEYSNINTFYVADDGNVFANQQSAEVYKSKQKVSYTKFERDVPILIDDVIYNAIDKQDEPLVKPKVPVKRTNKKTNKKNK